MDHQAGGLYTRAGRAPGRFEKREKKIPSSNGRFPAACQLKAVMVDKW